MVRTVAVIGAGASGLAALKSCLEEGLNAVCFEKADNVGGIWHFTETPKERQATVPRSTLTISSKLTVCFSDFPCPEEWPNYLRQSYMSSYLNMYAEKFALMPHIELQHEVMLIERLEDGNQWKIKLRNMKSNMVFEKHFDSVMICSGLYRDKIIPKIQGMESFEGKMLHSHDYMEPSLFKDKRVLVVGLGDSSTDAASEICKTAKQVFLSTRKGNWCYKRTISKGDLLERILFTRSVKFWLEWQSLEKANQYFEGICNEVLDHELYGIKPKMSATQTQPVVSDNLVHLLTSGDIILKSDVTKIDKTNVEFEDGTEEDIDIILFATGYTLAFPMLQDDSKMSTNHHSNLYKFVFPVEDKQPAMAFIGIIKAIGSHFLTCELQARWAARVFAGRSTLPSTEEMKADVTKQQATQDEMFDHNPKHVRTVPWIKYNDDIAEMIGCKPSMGSLLLRDPWLAKQVWYDMCVPAQYRLRGPGAWDGARDTILNIERAIRKPYQTR